MKKILLLFFIAFTLFSCGEDVDELELMEFNKVPPPELGINYYQLHQYDFDGQHEKFRIMSVQIDSRIANTSAGRVASGAFTSVSNGNWEDSDTWDLGVPTTDKETNIIVKDTVYALSISLAKESSITIQPPGVLIAESIDVAKEFNLNVESGAGLIVKNDITGAKDAVINITGVVAVGGNIDLAGGAVINNNSDSVYVCGTSNTPVGINAEKSCSEMLDEIEEFYDVVVDGTALPITLLYQCAIYDDELEGIKIEYETATEINSDYVIVNWSTDAENWITIDTITSNNAPSKYSTVHSF